MQLTLHKRRPGTPLFINQNCIGMKKILLLCLITVAAIPVRAQLFESFNGGILPANWALAQGIHVSDYSDPANACVSDFGLRTPGWVEATRQKF